MERMKALPIALLFFLLQFTLSCHRRSPLPVSVTRLSERVLVLDYLETKVIALAARDGLVIVDTHLSPGIMSEMMKIIEENFERDDYLYVINTHGHRDHTSGNQLFPDSILVGHEKCPEFMRQHPAGSETNLWRMRYRLSELEKELRSTTGEPEKENVLREEIRARKIILEDFEKKYVVIPPGRTFRDSLTLHGGDMTIHLVYCGEAHTNNDILIHVPEEKLVCTGDMYNDSHSLGFSVNRMIDVPKILSSMNHILKARDTIKYVIPTHTNIMSLNDLIAVRDLIKEKYQEFEDKKSAALMLEQIIRDETVENPDERFTEWKMSNGQDFYFLENEFQFLSKKLLWEGSLDEALEVLKFTVVEFPQSALAYDNLAEIYMKKGEMDSAIQYYEKSLQLFPENRNAGEIVKILRSRQ